jgi:hypothetical protein
LDVLTSLIFVLYYFIHIDYVVDYDESTHKKIKNLEDLENEYEGYLQLGADFYLIVLFTGKLLSQSSRVIYPIMDLFTKLEFGLAIIIGQKLAGKILSLLHLFRILSGVLFIVHIFCSSWIRFSKLLQIKLVDKYHDYVDEKFNESQVWNDLWQQYLYSFYLWAITMTSVGYGDSVSMADVDAVNNYSSDVWFMTLLMHTSVFAFYLCQAALISFLESVGRS